jgi:hypothetical protein
MRRPGEVHQALLDAAAELTTPDSSPTLTELAAKSQVGLGAALVTVKNMVRSGALVIVRTRRVDYRNRPVAEYATPAAVDAVTQGQCDMHALVSCWATPAA